MNRPRWSACSGLRWSISSALPNQNLANGKVCAVKHKHEADKVAVSYFRTNPDIYSYTFYNKYGIENPHKNGWELKLIDEGRVVDSDKVIFDLHISDPTGEVRQVRCHVYRSNWQAYGNRFIYIIASSIDYLLMFSSYESWQNPEADKISKIPSMIYKTYEALSMKHHEDLVRAIKKG